MYIEEQHGWLFHWVKMVKIIRGIYGLKEENLQSDTLNFLAPPS